MNSSKIIFVYAVDGGIVNSVIHSAHKFISPNTYSCNLCALTYGSFGMKKKWIQFIKDLRVETEFLHRDEFIQKYPSLPIELPAIYVEKSGEPKLVILALEIKACRTEEDLISLVKRSIQ